MVVDVSIYKKNRRGVFVIVGLTDGGNRKSNHRKPPPASSTDADMEVDS